MFKKSIIIILISMFLFSSYSFSQTNNSVPDEFAPKVWNKLSLGLQNAWLTAKKSGNMSVKFKCFLIVRDPPDSGDRDFLQSNGFNVLGALDFTTVSTGYVTAEDLPRVATLDFVKRINLVINKDKK